MQDENKTKTQLINELAELRQALADSRQNGQLQQEIARRVQAEEALRASEARFRGVLDNAADAIAVVDLSGRFTLFNRRSAEMLGYTSKELAAKTFLDITHPKDAHFSREHFQKLRDGEIDSYRLRKRYVRKDGSVLWVDASLAPIRNPDGLLEGILTIVTDITERMQAEEVLRQRNRELELLNRAGQAFVSTLDLEQVLATVLGEVLQVLNVVGSSIWLTERATDTGKETGDLVCHEAAGPGSDVVRGWRLAPGQGLAGWVAQSGESVYVPDVYKDERYFKGVEEESGLVLRSILTVPLQVRGKVVGAIQAVAEEASAFSSSDLTLMESLGSAAAVAIENAQLYQQAQREIADRMRAEAALRESEERFRRLAENARDIIYRYGVSPTLTFEYVNPAVTEITGYTPEECYADPDLGFRLVHPEDRPLLEAAIQANTTPVGKSPPVRWVRKDGEIVWTEPRNVPIFDEAGNLIAIEGIARDITERRRAEDALRESEERYRTLFEQANDGIHWANGEDKILDVNPRMCQMMGYSREELLTMSIPDLQAPKRRGPVGSVLKHEVAEYGNTSFESLNVHRDGTRIPVEVSVSPVKGLEGDLYISIVRDVTERKQAELALHDSNQRLEEALAELEATQEQVVQQERLAAVGQLAAGIAHDFNNLLTSIIGYAELVQMRPDIPPEVRADLGGIVKQGQRGAHLVQQILDFSRKSIRQPQPLNLVPFLKETVRFLERTIPETVHIQLEIEPEVCLVHADPTQLQQMVTNLAVNARDAMADGGELRLQLSDLTLEPGEPPPCPDMAAGDWIALSVSDTGTGIPPDVMPHIFEPFFTTRSPVGTGLGLAQVYGIVKQHAGHIDVESQVERGTRFSVFLPALVSAEMASQKEPWKKLPRGRGETVLLVEDEMTVLEACKAMLEHLGYRVLVAKNGQQALAIYADHQDQIALVLADMVMPVMDGVTLFHTLKKTYPGVKVVFTTGYAPDEKVREALTQGVLDWLQKPMTISDLAHVVSRALGH
jgi:PAS domain S-box-containing protein